MAQRNPKRAFTLAIHASDHLVSQRHFMAAAKILERYLILHPPHASVLRRLGRIRLRQGRPGDAVPLLTAALALDRNPVKSAPVAA